MKKYLVMYMAPASAIDTMMQNMTPEISKAHNDSWMRWMEENKSSIVDQGNMLGKNKRVSSAGVVDVRNDMTGYSMIEAESADAAAEIVKTNPMLQMAEAYIEVTEIMPMSGN
jgi:hypothetical protein